MKKLILSGIIGSLMMLASTFGFAADQKNAPKPIAPVVKSDPAKPAGSEPKAAADAAKQIDINTATEAELKTIPGIGDTYAKKIIAGRPYAKKDQLKTKKIVPDDVYGKIKDRIVAKQPKK